MNLKSYTICSIHRTHSIGCLVGNVRGCAQRIDDEEEEDINRGEITLIRQIKLIVLRSKA